jgi:AcrR family transcriptional regulator
MSSAHSKTMGAPKEARPAEIVAAALQLFSDRGFAATRLEDVATVPG